MRESCVVVETPHARTRLRVLCAEGFLDRLRGLLGREVLTRRFGFWISPCAAVHTLGMRASLDLVFVDRRGLVLRVDARVPPSRMRACRGAAAVLELAAGSAAGFGLDQPAARLDGPEALP